MRLSRIVILAAGLGALSACSDDEIVGSAIPPLGQVRFINAVADTAMVDIRAIDQVEYSPQNVGELAFRRGTEYQLIEAKSRQFRVFATSRNIAVTQVPLLDATVDIQANTRVTLLLVGNSRDKSSLRFITINDDATAPAAGMISVRVVNASTGAVDGYLVNTATDAITGSPAAANVATRAASAYVTRAATTTAALRFTNFGSSTVTASAAGPVATVISGANAAAGVNSAGTKFSVYYFGPGTAGSNNAALTTPAAVWFADRNPADI